MDPDIEENAPKVKGRIITTLEKAKEVRPAGGEVHHYRLSIDAGAGRRAAVRDQRGTQYRRVEAVACESAVAVLGQAMAPVLTARRRVLQMIGDKQAVRVLFSGIAPRFEQRDGGYTRILKLADPRLGDAGSARYSSWSAAMSESRR